MVYEMPALVGPHQGELLTEGRMEPLVDLPALFSGRKVNTVIWSFGAGLVLYGGSPSDHQKKNQRSITSAGEKRQS